MTREEIIQVCDLYAQGINELSKLTSQEGYSEELSELLNTMLKSKENGFDYTHDWIKKYVLNNSQINDNGKELLYVAQKTAERAKKEFISKACEWLNKELFTDWTEPNPYYDTDVKSMSYDTKEDLLFAFRKAMEE